MLDNIKLMLGITDTSKDDLISLLISLAQDEVKDFCNIEEIPAALNSTILQIVCIKYNQIGLEGLASQTFNGASQAVLATYPKFIISSLQRYRKVKLI